MRGSQGKGIFEVSEDDLDDDLEDGEVRIASWDATIADAFAAAELLIKKGDPIGPRMMEAAKVALERARGDRTKLLRDVCDQRLS
jgi:hypothetical protein